MNRSTIAVRFARRRTGQDAMASPQQTPDSKAGLPYAQPRPLHFGRLLLVCLAAIAFCGCLVWFAMTYLPDCCGPF